MSRNNRRFPIDRAGRDSGVVPIHDHDRTRMLYPSDLEYEEATEQGGLDFWRVLQVVLSRKWMILAITIVGVAMSFVLTLREIPMYWATATIEIQRQEVQILEGTNVGPDLVADATYMETQYRLLRSRYLGERVAEELNLPNDARFANQSLPRDQRLQQASRRVVAGLRISPAGRSRVVNVSFISPFQKESAMIANATAEAFIQSNLERKYNTTAFAREFLDERLASTKIALEGSERRLVEYAEQEGLLDLGGSTDGAGSLDENSIIALNNELSEAESARILAEQEYRTAANTPSFRELLDSPALTRMRETRSALLADYQEMLGQFKPEYPTMIRLQTRIDAVEEEIERETNGLIAALKVDFDAAVAREESLRSRVAELRSGLQDERNRRIQYRILQREVETIRSQYEALLQRSKEISVASGIGSSNVSIVDEALVPGRPFEPNIRSSMMQAFILSLAIGIGLAFALNFIDDTIKTPEDLRKKLGLAAIGVIPKVSKRKDAIVDALSDPRSQISEAFASARTALEFATEEGTPRSLLVTSTRPGEGKTSTTIALAMTFAKGGKQVLIIDADMRRPSFVTDSKKSVGLSGLLTGHDLLIDNVVRSTTEGLSILPSGVTPPNPAQLLSGQRLNEIITSAEEYFDVVIIDSPPVMSFTDSPRLGSAVEGTLVVIQAGLMRTPALKRTLSRLYEARSDVLGAVLSKFDAKKVGYEYSYYYSSYEGGGNSYVESGSRNDAKRKVLINAAPDDEKKDDFGSWA